MKSIERTQKLWDQYLEKCREYDLLDLEDPRDRKRRMNLMEEKIALLKKIRGAE